MASEREWALWYPAGDARLAGWFSQLDWVSMEGGQADPDAPLPVMLNLAKGADGRIVCRALVVGAISPYSGGPREVTSRSLRQIPVAELIEGAIASGQMPGGYGQVVRDLLDKADTLTVPKRRPGPNGISDEYLRMVAEMYRTAVEVKPTAPIQWMTVQLDRSEATVRRHVQRARDKGFLGGAIPGKAGEQGRRES